MGAVSTTELDRALRPPAHRGAARAKTWWTVRAGLYWIPAILIPVAAVGWTPHLGWTVAAGVAVVLLLAAVAHLIVMPRFRYAFHRWETNEVAVYAQHGWLTRSRVLIPISRVQVIDTVAGPLERIFGLATLTVTTASSAGTVRVEGLPIHRAQQLAGELTVRAAEDTDDAT
jgi:membrane protein YdbS with pleckstrin-like domain